MNGDHKEECNGTCVKQLRKQVKNLDRVVRNLINETGQMQKAIDQLREESVQVVTKTYGYSIQPKGEDHNPLLMGAVIADNMKEAMGKVNAIIDKEYQDLPIAWVRVEEERADY